MGVFGFFGVEGESTPKENQHATEAGCENGEYEVEDILDTRVNQPTGEKEYLIKWKNFSAIWNSWEPEDNLNCPSLLHHFWERRSSSTKDTLMPSLIPNSQMKKASSSIGDLYKSLSTTSYSENQLPHDLSPTTQIQMIAHSKRAVEGRAAATSGRSNEGSHVTGPKLPRLLLDNKIKKSQQQESIELFTRMMNKYGATRIRVENDVDLAHPPLEFKCIDKPIIREGVPKPDPGFIIGCDCGDDCGKSSSTLDCLCIAQNNDSRRVYNSEGRLIIDYGPIYECNFKCPCPKACSNRVVQRGSQVRLRVVRFNEEKGWGVVADEVIPKGSFVGVYLGEIITTAEGNRRAKNGKGDYLFDLDFNFEAGAESDFTIDSLEYGNVTHFINHSCDPNLKVHPCFIDSWDPRLHYLAFFAKRRISVGEELCFDYSGGRRNILPTGRRDKSTRCQCGTRNCKGTIY